MNFEIIKIPMAEIYYLANTPTYIYRRIVDTFTNIDLEDISEDEIDVYERYLGDDEKYLLYFLIYIKVKNGYKINEDMYKGLKWYDEFISYCQSKQVSTVSISIDYNREVAVND